MSASSTGCWTCARAGLGSGAGPGDRPLVIDSTASSARSTATRRRAPATATPTVRVSPVAGDPRRHRGGAAHPAAKGSANTQRGAERFVDELLARVRRAGHQGQIVIRPTRVREPQADGRPAQAGCRVLDRRQASKDDPGADRRRSPRATGSPITDYPASGEAQVAEILFKGFRLIVRRTRLTAQQLALWPDWRHHCFSPTAVPLLTADIDHRDHAQIELVIRDLKDQALAHFPSGNYSPTAPGP